MNTLYHILNDQNSTICTNVPYLLCAGGLGILQSLLHAAASSPAVHASQLRMQRKALALLIDVLHADPSLIEDSLQPGEGWGVGEGGGE